MSLPIDPPFRASIRIDYRWSTIVAMQFIMEIPMLDSTTNIRRAINAMLLVKFVMPFFMAIRVNVAHHTKPSIISPD
jgi:hypothetical protein